MTVQSVSSGGKTGWRTPAVVLVVGSVIAMVSFGPRSALGFFLTPMSQDFHWGRDVFSMALAIQNLLWGVGQPFAGGLADRYGANRVLIVGTLLYAAGLALMAHATNGAMLDLSAGVLIGFGLSGASFTIVLGAFGKLLPPEWRSIAFGAGTAAGSFGQFVYSPVAVALIDKFGWQSALVIFAVVTLIVVPLAMALAAPRNAAPSTEFDAKTGGVSCESGGDGPLTASTLAAPELELRAELGISAPAEPLERAEPLVF